MVNAKDHSPSIAHYMDIEEIWNKGTLEYVIGKDTDKNGFSYGYMAQVTEAPGGEVNFYQYKNEKPSRSRVEKDHMSRSAKKLAIAIDRFTREHDPYEYADQVEDSEENVQKIATDIENGNAGYLTDYLQDINPENAEDDEIKRAQALLRQLSWHGFPAQEKLLESYQKQYVSAEKKNQSFTVAPREQIPKVTKVTRKPSMKDTVKLDAAVAGLEQSESETEMSF